MSEYKQFVFESYDFERASKTLVLRYSLDKKVHFEEIFCFDHAVCENPDWDSIDRAARALWIMAGVSYFKAALPSEIVFSDDQLHTQEKEFFETVWNNGLGEFFYQNKIAPHGKINFVGTEKKDVPKLNETKNLDGFLVPMGGGKDSLTTTTILEKNDQAFTTWTVGHFPFMEKITNTIGAPHAKVTRKISPELLRMNREGASNGHVPITAILAFASVVSALLMGKKHIALSNEASANEPNVEWEGLKINHQYSKTLECERMIQKYIETFVSPSVKYFSFLRPFCELKIAELFCTHAFEKYKNVFSSCNRNFHINKDQKEIFWCGKCPKCAFIACIFAPFLKAIQLEKLFGENIFAEPELEQTYQDLMGLGAHKPFECVGEYDEIAMALRIAQKSGEYPILDDWVIPEVPFDPEKMHAHCMPTDVFKMLEKVLASTWENVLIYGYGKSGKSSEKFVQHKNINAEIEIFDANIEAYSAEPDFEKFDCIILSPGIERKQIPTKYHKKIKTNTEIFFDGLNEKQRKKVIGITGTKGKSTTAKFVHEVLEKAGKKSVIGGNYGVPLLDVYPQMDSVDFVVAELSSYQLEYLKKSPHLALCTNLFADHLDRHKTIGAYHKAKANLWKHQTKNDHVFFLKQYAAVCEPYATESEKHFCVPFFPKKLDRLNPIQAPHFLENFGLVVGLCAHLGLEKNILETVFETFEGLPHRLTKVAEVNGKIFFDDSISTTPESALASATFFGERLRVLMVGGQDRNQDFVGFLKTLKTIAPNVLLIVLPSETTSILRKAQHQTEWPKDQFFVADTMQLAVEKAMQTMTANDVCVMSPAAPSYDKYKNYIARGTHFLEIIKAWKQ